MPLKPNRLPLICAQCSKEIVRPTRRARAVQKFCSTFCYGRSKAGRPSRPIRSLADRFWEKVDKTSDPDGCWLWTASVDGHGYGQIGVGNPMKLKRVTRVSWELGTGASPPDDLDVLHHCDKPRCVRYDKCLFLGDASANARDREGKRRGGHITHPESIRASNRARKAKLAPSQVIEIRRRRTDEGLSYSTLGTIYGVTLSTIGSIVQRETWKDI